MMNSTTRSPGSGGAAPLIQKKPHESRAQKSPIIERKIQLSGFTNDKCLSIFPKSAGGGRRTQ